MTTEGVGVGGGDAGKSERLLVVGVELEKMGL